MSKSLQKDEIESEPAVSNTKNLRLASILIEVSQDDNTNFRAMSCDKVFKEPWLVCCDSGSREEKSEESRGAE